MRDDVKLESLVPDSITVCARCGYQAWRENYPCNRCGGLKPRIYAPVDAVVGALRAELERLRAMHAPRLGPPADGFWPADFIERKFGESGE